MPPQKSRVSLANLPVGGEREQIVRVRIGQSFFRQVVLTAYEHRCCVSGLTHDALLVASHIKPWRESEPENERTNPHNGLCLSALYDKAFDAGLMTLDETLRVVFSKSLRERTTPDIYQRFFEPYHGQVLQHQSARFSPTQDFLSYHRNNIFEQQG